MGEHRQIAPAAWKPGETLEEMLWSTEDFYALVDRGVFAALDGAVELIDGRIVMSPSDGAPHMLGNALVYRAVRTIEDALLAAGLQVYVVPNGALKLGPRRAISPDWMILPVGAVLEQGRRAEPKDVLLAIEVTDENRRFDEGDKRLMYAEAGVGELWILNLPDRRLTICRAPEGGAYREERRLEAGENIAPLTAPGALIAVANLLPGA